MVYNFFDKKTALLANKSAAGGAFKNKIMQNKELAEDLHKFKGICFLLCVIDIYIKYALAITLKDKKGITILTLFKKF